jgi:hypothetical protein
MWFWYLNEMTALVSGMPAPQFGTNLRECEDQSWFKARAVPVFRFDWRKMSSRTPAEDQWSTLIASGKVQSRSRTRVPWCSHGTRLRRDRPIKNFNNFWKLRILHLCSSNDVSRGKYCYNTSTQDIGLPPLDTPVCATTRNASWHYHHGVMVTCRVQSLLVIMWNYHHDVMVTCRVQSLLVICGTIIMA